jgi:hypothetical protein
VQQGIIDTLQFLFVNEEKKSIRKKTNDVVGLLAAKAISAQQNNWPQLFPAMVQMFSTGNASRRESVMDVLSKLAEFSIVALMPAMNDVAQILQAGLKDQDMVVRVSGLKACISLITAIEDPKVKQGFSQFIPAMFKILAEAFQRKDDYDVTNCLTDLMDIAFNEAEFMRGHLTEVCDLVMQIVTSQDVSQDTRRVAYEFMLVLCSSGKADIRKMKNLTQRVVQITFMFMSRIEHNPQQWNSYTEDEYDLEDFFIGQDGVHRLSLGLGEKMFCQFAFPIISQWLGSQNWAERHAAASALAKMADPCSQTVSLEVTNFVKALVPMILNDQHPRCQWAAIDALAFLSTTAGLEAEPTLQQAHYSDVFPALLSAMNTQTRNPRVLAHAALALVDFQSGIEEDVEDSKVLAYMQPVLQACHGLMNLNNNRVREAALACVAQTATVCQEKFIPMYDVFMPILKQILAAQDTTGALNGVKARAIECMGKVALAVGRDKFKVDANEVVQYLLSSLQAGIKTEDPALLAIHDCLSCLARCLKEDFGMALPSVVPHLLAQASQKNACVIENTSEANPYADMKGYTTESVNLRFLGEKTVSVNTSMLAEITQAIKCLGVYAENAPIHFGPYVNEAVNIIVPQISFKLNDKVRAESVSACGPMLKSAAAYAKAANKDIRVVQIMFNLMLKPVTERLDQEGHLDQVALFLDGLSELVDADEVKINAQHCEYMNEKLKTILDVSEFRREEREKRRQLPSYDEVEEADIAFENEEEDSLIGSMHLVLLAMVKKAGTDFMPSWFQHLYQLFVPMFGNGRSDDNILAAACVLADVIEHSGALTQGKVVMVSHFYPITCKLAASKDINVKQAGVFGIGACAKAYGSKMGNAVQPAVNFLLQTIKRPDAKTSEKNGSITDDAIGALGKICRFCQPQNAQLLGQWISFLPVKNDEEECREIYQQLTTYIVEQNPVVVQQLPKVIKLLAQAIAYEDGDLLHKHTEVQVKQIWAQLVASKSPLSVQVAQQLTQQEGQTLSSQ